MKQRNLSLSILSGLLTGCRYIAGWCSGNTVGSEPATGCSIQSPASIINGGVIQRKLFLILILVFALSVSVFADDLQILTGDDFNTFGNLTASDYGVQTVDYSVSVTGVFYQSQYVSNGNHNFVCSSNGESDSYTVPSGSTQLRYTTGTVNIGAGSATVVLPAFASGMSVTSTAEGVTITMTSNGFVVTSDGTTNPIPLSFGSTRADVTAGSSITMTSSYSGDPYVPSDPYAGSGSMFGWTGDTLLKLELSESEKWYTYTSGSKSFGQMDSLWSGMDGEGTLRGEVMNTNMLASLAWNKWKWSIDPTTGLPKFEMDSWSQGSWADMIYRTSVYNYFYASKLWSNDVSGSWYGSISNSFSYLNYRVNQILEVLANDEDLAIKEATDDERQWVQDYFENGSDIADSGKYDKINGVGSSFKDAFEGAPDTSISDGLTAINDNGYDFWSSAIQSELNGDDFSSNSISTYSDDPSQRIVDSYSENFKMIQEGRYG